MVYLPRHMDEAHLERQFRNEIDQVRRELEQRIDILERPERAPVNLIASPNYILNSHPEWSKAAWENTGVSAGTVTDDNRTCYNWYFQAQADSAQQLGLSPGASSAVIASGHTAFAGLNANAPVWDQVNARFLVGHTGTSNVYDIACPLSRDFIFPGQRYYVYFETLLTDPSVELEGAEFYCGFWDNTGAPATVQQKWIEGSPFTPDYGIYGAGGTRTLTYKVLAATDGGDELLSNTITVVNAPNTLTPTNHVRLTFTGAPGFIQFKIYRYDGLVYRLVGDIRNSIDLQFFDMQENGGSLETGFPTLSGNRPLAKKTTVGLTGNSTTYTAHTMVVQVPTTYNRSLTTNNSQWFRFGLNKEISAARGLAIRRLMVSEGYGPWVRAQGDLTLPGSSPSSTATSAPSPGTTVGGGPDNGPYCVTLDTEVEVINVVNGADRIDTIPIANVKVGMNVVCGTSVLPIQRIIDGIVQETYTIYTERGFEVTCSGDHRLIKSRFDMTGTAARNLKIGDRLLTSEEGTMAQDIISEITLNIGETPVRTLSLPNPHWFVTNGLVSHNSKQDPEVILQV